jgi:integrase
MREGEILGLTLDRVEFLRRRIPVNRQLRTPNSGRPVLAPTKTESSDRTIPQGDVVMTALSEHIRLYPPDLIEIDEYTERGVGAKPKKTKVRFLYLDSTGKPIPRNRFIDKIWKPTVARAEAALRAKAADAKRAGRTGEAETLAAAADRLVGKVDFHELRHYYASLLIFAGENVKVVQARLGHKSATETLDTYGHLWPDSDDATRAAVDAVLGPALSTPTVQARSGDR